jgi:NOL1/NOP2/fmu family ribosome biogenesis protein
VDVPPDRLHAHNGRLYLLPKTTLATRRVHVLRYGLYLGQARPGRFLPAHDLALTLRADDVQAAADWPAGDPRLAAYLAGSDQPLDGPNGWVMVAVDGYGLGWGKRSGGRLKNHYPRHLRRVTV